MQTLESMLAEARSGLRRVNAAEIAAAQQRGALLVDHRDSGDQLAEGMIPGSISIRRSVLEWRLAPSSEWQEVVVDTNTQIICVCNDGESSSLAAASLQKLGLVGATDLVGGYRAWAALPGSVPCAPDDALSCTT
jgi:rhodanese-related sulfurtransferase